MIQSDFVSISVDSLFLESGAVGSRHAPLQVIQSANQVNQAPILDIDAKYNIYVANPNGALILNKIVSHTGGLDVQTFGNIEQTQIGQTAPDGTTLAEGGLIQSSGLNLVSSGGQIGTADAYLRIDSNYGWSLEKSVSASARTNIYIHELGKTSDFQDGDLFVKQIESTQGDVYLRVDGGGVRDWNTETNTSTYFASETWKQSLENRGVTAGKTQQANLEQIYDSYEYGKALEYNEFWDYGRANPEYDANYQFAFTDEQRELYKGEDYRYTDAMLDAEQQRRTDFYHQVLFDGRGTEATYNTDFVYVMSISEQDILSQGSDRSYESIRDMIPLDAYLTSEPVITEKPPNLIARNVTIDLEEGAGSVADSLTFAAGTKFSELTDAEKLALQTVIPGDVAYAYNEDGEIVAMSVKQYKEAVLKVSGEVTITSHAPVYLRADEGITVVSINTQDNVDKNLYHELRITSTAGIHGLAGTDSRIACGNLTLYANAEIGTLDQPLIVTQYTDSQTRSAPTLYAYANKLVNIASDSSILVDRIVVSGGRLLKLTTTGSDADILGLQNLSGSQPNLTANQIDLTASGNVGTENERLHFVGHSAAGESQPTTPVLTADAQGNIYLSGQAAVELSDIVSRTGDIDIQSVGAVFITGTVELFSADPTRQLALQSRTGSIENGSLDGYLSAPLGTICLNAATGIGTATGLGASGAIRLNGATLTGATIAGSAHFYQTAAGLSPSDPPLTQLYVNQFDVFAGNLSVVSDSTLKLGALSASGELLTKSDGNLYITNDLTADKIFLIGESDQSLLLSERNPDGLVPVLTGSYINLTSGARIGQSETAPLHVQLVANQLDVMGKQGIYLEQLDGNMNFQRLLTEGTAWLMSDSLLCNIQIQTLVAADYKIVTHGTTHIVELSDCEDYSIPPRSDEMAANNPASESRFDVPTEISVEKIKVEGETVEIDRVKARRVEFETDYLNVGELISSKKAEVGVPIHVGVKGFEDNKFAQSVRFDRIASTPGVIFDWLYANRAQLTAQGSQFVQIVDGQTNDFVEIMFNQRIVSRLDALDKTARKDLTHLWTQTGLFAKYVDRIGIQTDAYVLNYDPTILINDRVGSQNSVERMTNSERRAYRSERFRERWFEFEREPAFIPE